MARPTWTGTISFGLVNVPVKAFTAVRDHDVHFNQLHKKTGARIRNKRVSETSGREVDTDEIAMGFEVTKGKYVTFDKDELKELQPASTRAIEVTDFVALEDVDPIYYERTYWLTPADDRAKDAYALLLAAMEDRDRAAIGTVVMRNKEYLTAIRPLDGALAMSTMRFADEVVPRAEIDGIPRRSKPEAKAVKLATQIVDSLAGDWDPKRYHDTYAEELRRRIRAKGKGKPVAEDAAAPEEGDAKIVDLMEALEASVSRARGRRTIANRTTKRAPAKTATAKRTGRRSSARKSA
jgi:DNA end-binding protein Ku